MCPYPMIYLDYNATTPLAAEAREAMLPFLAEQYGNPSSAHRLGRAAREAVDRARRQVAALLGAEPDEILFTSGGTESNNLALKGVAFASPPGTTTDGLRPGHLVISAIEHPAVTEPAAFLARLGWQMTVVAADRQCLVDPSAVAAALRDDTRLVSIMHANNEIGVIQPIRAISDICRARGVLVHTDAAQSVGKVPVDVNVLGVDLLSIAGHKLYAPKGVGALYARRGTRLEPLLHGAGHESGRRAGTENVPYLVALGRAAELAVATLDETAARMATLRDRLYERLRAVVGAGLSVNGAGAPRLPNTLSVNFPKVAGDELLARAAELCASTGAACHAGHTRLSATLAAIGLDPNVARGTVRLSLGRSTTAAEIDRAAELLCAAWRQCIRQG
ncbi:MAG TPA: cysteine desulfurase family protein [Pirellulales bacterium]|nr:cysteine desulfurase family protein [Pirellulales bacterium]